MLSGEKKNLSNLIIESLIRDIEREDLHFEERNQKIKFLIGKDEQDCFCLVEDTSIKCVFEENNLREYINSLPSFIKFENLQGSQILLKKYRFDYLLIKLSEDNNAIRVICYIEDFEIDSTHKTITDNFPLNINNNSGVKSKLQSIMHIFEKTLIKSSSFNKERIEASNFITRAFNNHEDNIKNIFDLLPNRNNNILIKSKISINNPFSFVLISDTDNLINEQLKKYDFKKVFIHTPTQLEKDDNKKLLEDLSRDPSSVNLKPCQLKINLTESKSTHDIFLNNKTKRAKPIKESEKLPTTIQNLISNYADVTANISAEIVEKYKIYKRFQNYTTKAKN